MRRYKKQEVDTPSSLDRSSPRSLPFKREKAPYNYHDGQGFRFNIR